jgi:hypothetical protein
MRRDQSPGPPAEPGNDGAGLRWRRQAPNPLHPSIDDAGAPHLGRQGGKGDRPEWMVAQRARWLEPQNGVP